MMAVLDVTAAFDVVYDHTILIQQLELEGHSVECVYLRQSCFDG